MNMYDITDRAQKIKRRSSDYIYGEYIKQKEKGIYSDQRNRRYTEDDDEYVWNEVFGCCFNVIEAILDSD